MQAKRWLDNDVSMDVLKSQTIAVIGYGIQGRAQATNMRDSGLDVIVGLRREGNSWTKAEKEGHKVAEIGTASKQASIIHILVPDMEQSATYRKHIAMHLSEGKALSFSHGAAIHWKWIQPPDNVDVIMVAPKGPGQESSGTLPGRFWHAITCCRSPRLIPSRIEESLGSRQVDRKYTTRSDSNDIQGGSRN